MSEEKSEDGGRWYFLRKEIEENSPSRSDGIDLKKETYLRKSYCTFLQDLGMRLKVEKGKHQLKLYQLTHYTLGKLPQVTIAIAIIFCHRFYLRQSHAKNDRRTVATACIFLAGKVEETPRPLKDVILVSYEIIHKKDPAAAQKIKQKEVYEQQKDLILLAERVVLATLGFDLNLQHPYKPLVEAIKKFKVAQHALAQVAWNFVNDGLRTSLCLQFESHHVAAGAIFLAAKFLKVKLPSDGEVVWWQEFDVTPRQLEEISNQMLELYEQNKGAPSQVGEAEFSVAGGAANQADLRNSTEDHVTNSNASQGKATARTGTVKPSTAAQLPDNLNKHDGRSRSSQSKNGDYGGSDRKSLGEPKASESLVHQETLEEIQNGTNGLESNNSEERREKNPAGSITKEGAHDNDNYVNKVESKEVVSTQSPSDMKETIDTNKLKELREKRKKSRADVVRKIDLVDEFDPIVKELEEGVELAVAESEKIKQERKKNWSQLSARLDSDSKRLGKSGDGPNVGSKAQYSDDLDVKHVEEGDMSTLDDSNCDYHSPKSNYRKRKAGSPGDQTSDGKRLRDSEPGELSEEKSRVTRAEHPNNHNSSSSQINY